MEQEVQMEQVWMGPYGLNRTGTLSDFALLHRHGVLVHHRHRHRHLISSHLVSSDLISCAPRPAAATAAARCCSPPIPDSIRL
jgi:hypothetical protein